MKDLCMSLQGIESISFSMTQQLATGTYTRELIIVNGNDTEIHLDLFSEDKANLMPKIEEGRRCPNE